MQQQHTATNTAHNNSNSIRCTKSANDHNHMKLHNNNVVTASADNNTQ